MAYVRDPITGELRWEFGQVSEPVFPLDPDASGFQRALPSGQASGTGPLYATQPASASPRQFRYDPNDPVMGLRDVNRSGQQNAQVLGQGSQGIGLFPEGMSPIAQILASIAGGARAFGGNQNPFGELLQVQQLRQQQQYISQNQQRLKMEEQNQKLQHAKDITDLAIKLSRGGTSEKNADAFYDAVGGKTSYAEMVWKASHERADVLNTYVRALYGDLPDPVQKKMEQYVAIDPEKAFEQMMAGKLDDLVTKLQDDYEKVDAPKKLAAFMGHVRQGDTSGMRMTWDTIRKINDRVSPEFRLHQNTLQWLDKHPEERTPFGLLTEEETKKSTESALKETDLKLKQRELEQGSARPVDVEMRIATSMFPGVASYQALGDALVTKEDQGRLSRDYPWVRAGMTRQQAVDKVIEGRTEKVAELQGRGREMGRQSAELDERLNEKATFWINEQGEVAKPAMTRRDAEAKGYIPVTQPDLNAVGSAKAGLVQLKEYGRLRGLLTERAKAKGLMGDILSATKVQGNRIGIWLKALGGDPEARKLQALFGAIATIARATGDTANIAVQERQFLKNFVMDEGDTIESADAKAAQAERILRGVVKSRNVPIPPGETDAQRSASDRFNALRKQGMTDADAYRTLLDEGY